MQGRNALVNEDEVGRANGFAPTQKRVPSRLLTKMPGRSVPRRMTKVSKRYVGSATAELTVRKTRCWREMDSNHRYPEETLSLRDGL
jgi:hypothetical protein